VQAETDAEAGEFGEALRAASVARLDPRTVVKAGERVTFGLDSTRLHFFDSDTGEAIWQ
jgi:multiple sugar transport system ATP-binding protein